jgi:hypothetical protein
MGQEVLRLVAEQVLEAVGIKIRDGHA